MEKSSNQYNGRVRPRALRGPKFSDKSLRASQVRSELARLRSGFSRNLNSYMNRIDPSIADTCPACNSTPHDTDHLFNCNSKPTHLEPSALWTNPKQSALFLELLPEVKEERTNKVGIILMAKHLPRVS